MMTFDTIAEHLWTTSSLAYGYHPPGAMSATSMEDSMLSYIHVPQAAQRIPGPTPSSYAARIASFPPTATAAAAGTAKDATSANINQSAAQKGKATVKDGSYLSNSVSDLLLSSILPSSIPNKAPQPATNQTAGGSRKITFDKPRPLTSQREPLSLQLMTNNFRRFVARIGPVFWVQDRIEEVMYWRKPVWTLTWIVGWGLISFYPRLLLICPTVAIILILLHQYEKSHPSISSAHSSPNSSIALTSRHPLVGAPIMSNIAASFAQNTDPSTNPKIKDDSDDSLMYAHGSTVDAEGREVPAIAPGPPESAVDYYMNLQGIQNLMGVISDAHDTALPYIALINPTSSNPSPPPTTFPLSVTHLLMLCLPPTILLPLVPAFIVSWILFAAGVLPTIIFHPSLTSDSLKGFVDSVTRGRRYWRAKAERWVLTDRLDDRIANSEIREVNVWEHERLDPVWAANAKTTLESASKDPLKVPKAVMAPPRAAWSASHLKAADKQAWVRTIPLIPQDSLWKDDASPLEHVENGDDVGREKRASNGKVALLLIKGWSFVPGEEWRVDLAGQWSPVGVDEDGWVYSDDEWHTVYPEPLVRTIGPDGVLRTILMTTRRRQWWRRVVHG